MIKYRDISIVFKELTVNELLSEIYLKKIIYR